MNQMEYKKIELREVVTPGNISSSVLRKGDTREGCKTNNNNNMNTNIAAERTGHSFCEETPCGFRRGGREYYEDVEFYDALFEGREYDYLKKKSDIFEGLEYTYLIDWRKCGRKATIGRELLQIDRDYEKAVDKVVRHFLEEYVLLPYITEARNANQRNVRIVEILEAKLDHFRAASKTSVDKFICSRLRFVCAIIDGPYIAGFRKAARLQKLGTKRFTAQMFPGLGKIDDILSRNSENIESTMANLNAISTALANAMPDVQKMMSKASSVLDIAEEVGTGISDNQDLLATAVRNGSAVLGFTAKFQELFAPLVDIVSRGFRGLAHWIEKLFDIIEGWFDESPITTIVTIVILGVLIWAVTTVAAPVLATCRNYIVQKTCSLLFPGSHGKFSVGVEAQMGGVMEALGPILGCIISAGFGMDLREVSTVAALTRIVGGCLDGLGPSVVQVTRFLAKKLFDVDLLPDESSEMKSWMEEVNVLHSDPNRETLLISDITTQRKAAALYKEGLRMYNELVRKMEKGNPIISSFMSTWSKACDMNRKAWSNNRGVNQRIRCASILLYGPPGTGKTTLQEKLFSIIHTLVRKRLAESNDPRLAAAKAEACYQSKYYKGMVYPRVKTSAYWNGYAGH